MAGPLCFVRNISQIEVIMLGLTTLFCLTYGFLYAYILILQLFFTKTKTKKEKKTEKQKQKGVDFSQILIAVQKLHVVSFAYLLIPAHVKRKQYWKIFLSYIFHIFY